MKKQNYFQTSHLFEDSDELNDYTDTGSNAPKHSPMRRREKFRVKPFQAQKKHKERKRGYRNKIQYDFGFWEE